MKRLLMGLTLVVAAGSSSFGAVDPNVKISDIPGVVSQCEKVASTETSSNNTPNPNAGLCIGSTQAFLDGLKAADPALTAEAFDKQISDLVVALVPLAQEQKTCNAVDDEIARAIALASGYSHTDQQKQQLLQISQTVAKCDFGGTAALPPATPAIPNVVRASPTV